MYQKPKPTKKRVKPRRAIFILSAITPFMAPTIPTVSRAVKNMIHIIAFGNPNTELCHIFRIFEQLNSALMLHASGALGFSKIAILSISNTNDATSPTAEAVVSVL
jgi:hypothetical protein